MVFGHVRRVLRRIRAERGGAQAPILIQRQVTSPEVMLAFRAALVLGLLTAISFVIDLVATAAQLRQQPAGRGQLAKTMFHHRATEVTLPSLPHCRSLCVTQPGSSSC